MLRDAYTKAHRQETARKYCIAADLPLVVSLRGSEIGTQQSYATPKYPSVPDVQVSFCIAGKSHAPRTVSGPHALHSVDASIERDDTVVLSKPGEA